MSETDGPRRGRKKAEPKGQEPQSADTAPGGDAASVAPNAPASPPEPPHNPWSPGGDEPAKQRRSANIEDIFRARGGGSGAPRGAPKPAWLGLAVLGVVTAWMLSTSVHILAQGERAVVTTFGRYAGTIGPGLNFTLPWPVQQVTRRDVGKELVTLLPDKEAETLMLTRDGEVIDVRSQVRWRVNDLRAFTTAFPDGEAALRRFADAAIREAVAELSFDDIRSGKHQTDLQRRVGSRLERLLGAMKAGVTISAVEVTQARPPARLAETFKAIDTATSDATKNRENANKLARNVRYLSQVEADAFDAAYANYRLAPSVWRTRMYYETLDKVRSANTVVAGSPAAPAADQQGGR